MVKKRASKSNKQIRNVKKNVARGKSKARPKFNSEKKNSKKDSKSKNLKMDKKVSKSKKNKRKYGEEFFKLGIPGIDALIGDGIPVGTTNLVEGGPGSGKTIFCLSVLMNACMSGKKVLYMSFEEPEERLRSHMTNFGWDPKKCERAGTLMIKRFNALDIARSVEALLSEAKKELLIDVQPVLIPKDFTPDLVIIDSLSSIASAFSGEENRFRIYMEQLFRYLEGHDMTSLLIRETANPTHIGNSFIEQGEAVSFLSDGIISIYNVVYDSGKRARALEVIKMRGVDINRQIVEADILPGRGFVVHKKPLKGKYQLT